ncbi:putative Beta-glucosidase [Melia azedarach]|uniref:Beta-glucosidase n=1 Tax=Melia azedarach TaxID=155640 RepID=A0ACC1Y0V7_MELAZ|nr:putative Beta-glucosidase [Melia azedarach]
MSNKGGRGPSIWDPFVHTPGNIAGNATADLAVDQYHRYKDDIDLMVKLNFDAYRFSISWSRIFPSITPYANLYHYDLPLALQEKYLGMLDCQFVKDYADYAEFCFKTFGDRVKNWHTFNEPRVIAALGFDNGINPPLRCSKEVGNCTAGNSGTEPYIAAHNMILAHAAAVERYREKYQKTQKGKIGILLDFVWFEPLTHSKADALAAQRARDFTIGWFLHPLTYGEYPKTMQEIVGDRLPKFTDEEVRLVKGSIDILGVNQYTSYYMSNPSDGPSNISSYQNDWNVGFAYHRKGVQIGQRANSNWLYIVPWGLYKAVSYVKERYQNPVMILSENGMDDPGNYTLAKGLDDTVRVSYYKGYLKNLKKAVDDGANVVGYFAWSLVDNFEWLSGYTSRFGIVYIDYDTLKRYPKMSACWFRQLLQRH